jgi:MFS family permease
VRFDSRYLAVAFCGSSAFLDMYATQPLLPLLRAEFHAGEAAVGATVTALTFATALAAPVVGPLADAIGRKRVIVTAIVALALVTFAAASATSLRALIAWRFAQGLFMPAVFAVTLAYIAEEFPREIGGRIVGTYMAGNVFGGFFGRYLSALVASRAGWQGAFLVLGALNLAGAAVVLVALPRARRFRRQRSALEALRAMCAFLRDRQLLGTYTVGASILFSLVAAFTFATYYLAAPPFHLSTVALGNVFCVYLFGIVSAPLAGRAIDRIGHRATVLLSLGVSAAGIFVTLIPNLWAVVAGLALMANGVFCAQVASQGFIGVIAQERRSTAAALYLTLYYFGGGLGAIAPAPLWARAGWSGTVGLIVALQLVTAALVMLSWRGRARVTEVARTSVSNQ